MSATSRELVLQTLNFQNPIHAPRQLWILPWAIDNYPDEVNAILEDFPSDFIGVVGHWKELPPTKGNPYKNGLYVDEWGCTFNNVAEGIIGEVKTPLIMDWNTDVDKVHIPTEWLTIDIDLINKDCAATDKFVMGAPCPRPFEQLQFLRGTENLYVDLIDPSKQMIAFVKQMHSLYCEILEVWAKTDVDGLMFMDDWGSQHSLLIRPEMWREIFKPMYRDFIQIIHGAGKAALMHSDGHILSIYPDLIDMGLDAINSQVFCMGTEKLTQFAGKITFWGEIDRQHILPNATTDEIDAAVKLIHNSFWKDGGCIAQCEFGPSARPENVRQVFASWDAISSRPTL